MSEENIAQTNNEENIVKNNSTEADKNVPYDRFSEVNVQKNDALEQVGKLQAQIDKMNQTSKDKEQGKLIEDGKLKEALGIITKERDDFKTQAEQWTTYQTSKRETLMEQLSDDSDKTIAEGLSLDKLELYVNKIINVKSPSTSTARAAIGAAGEMGGYDSFAEWAEKDPKGYKAANQTNVSKGIKIGYGN